MVLALSVSCNRRDSMLETPTVPPVGSSAVIPAVMLGLLPAAVMGGNTSVGTVTLAQRAPAGGTLVMLTSGHPAISVPQSVTVAAGGQTATFPVSTTSVAADTSGSVSAAASASVATAPLALWAVLPIFYSSVSDDGRYFRLTPQTTQFAAECTNNRVDIFIGLNTVTFAAPIGTPIRAGTYEGATGVASATSPGLYVLGTCSVDTRGRFVVHEVSLTPTGTVRQFWATFEESCSEAPTVRGEVRVTDVPMRSSSVRSCLLP
jgi:hypothetical protein